MHYYNVRVMEFGEGEESVRREARILSGALLTEVLLAAINLPCRLHGGSGGDTQLTVDNNIGGCQSVCCNISCN